MRRAAFHGSSQAVSRQAAVEEWLTYIDGFDQIEELSLHLHRLEDWRKPVWNGNEAGGFPPLVFLQLLFGRRSLDDLRYAYPDVWANDDAVPLLNTLFPASPSWAVPLG